MSEDEFEYSGEFEDDEQATTLPEGPRASTGEVTLFGWLTIVAAVCFAVVLILQMIELKGYGSI